MTGTEFDIEKFDRKNDFGLWQVRMKALLEQQGLATGRLVGDLATIDTTISDEDRALLLLTSLPSSYDNFVDTLLYGRDTLKLVDVLVTLNSRELQKMTEAKGDGGEGLYVRGRSSQRDIEHGMQIMYPVGADGYDNANVMMARELLDWIMDSESSYYITYMRDYLVDFKEYDGGNILLGDDRECRVRGTGKVQVQMRDGSSFVLDSVRYVPELRGNLISLGTLEKESLTVKMQSGKIKRSTQQCTKSRVAKHLGVAGLQQQNGLVEETNMTLLAKVRCFLIQSGLSKVLWAEDTTMSTNLVNKVMLYRNMGFNESEEYMKTFIGSGVGTGSVQELQGVEFEGATLNNELFSDREDSNEAAFAIAEAKKIDAHESLTFNNTVACEVIFKWKTGLKDDMDARSDVYVLSNGCKKCSDDSDVYYWEYTCIHLFLYIDDMVFLVNARLRSWLPRVLHLLEGHSILSLEGSLSGDYDVEKNDRRSFLWILTTPWEDRSLSWVDQSQEYMTLTEAAKEAKGTCNRVSIRAKDSSGYCYMCLVKGRYPWSEVPA
ncbi:hypothetical protein Tco_0542095 [Tanacetum coccineum]